MELKIYIDGKLDHKNELRWQAKKAAWHTYVWLESLFINKRFPTTFEEKERAHSIAMSFARGERRPY